MGAVWLSKGPGVIGLVNERCAGSYFNIVWQAQFVLGIGIPDKGTGTPVSRFRETGLAKGSIGTPR